jgi:hypothetical protein
MTTRDKVIKELKKFFSIEELVCQHTFQKYGEKAWRFFDTETLLTLLIVRRDIIKSPLVCNTETSHQRGLRCNLCPLVKTAAKHYLSAHIQGKAFDLLSKEFTAAQMRKMIAEKQALLPVPVRMESGVSWLHIDTFDPTNGKQKIVFFE